MKKLILPALISSLIIGLSACGQTGPLYLPDQDKANSGSTIANSGSSLENPGSTIDNDDTSKQSNTKELNDNQTQQSESPISKTNPQSTYQSDPSKAPNSETQNSKTNTNSNKETTNNAQNLSSGSSIKQSNKVDNDPTPPAKNYNTPASELIDTGDNFNYDKNIQDSSDAGGTPDI